MKHQLSSRNLYHFTRQVETLRLILENGFRYSLLPENVITEQNQQLIFGISFCDIPFHSSIPHRECYGNFAIGLTKAWGIEKGITPVRYVHKTSPGVSQNYLRMKDYTNKIRLLSAKEKTSYPVLYLLILKTLLDKTTGKLDYAKDFSEFNNHHAEFGKFYDFLKGKDDEFAHLFTDYISLLQYRITELENELTSRNVLIRNYEENFKCPITDKIMKGKRLYDEREWRAFKTIKITESNMKEKITETQSFLNQRYLPKEHNLTFSPNEIVAIVVSTGGDKQYLIDNLSRHGLIKSVDIESKIQLTDAYNETEN